MMKITEITNALLDGEETQFMLHKVQSFNILKFMDGRRTRNANLFQKMSSTTPEQIRIKWKNLRSAYSNAKRNNSKSGQGRVSCSHTPHPAAHKLCPTTRCGIATSQDDRAPYPTNPPRPTAQLHPTTRCLLGASSFLLGANKPRLPPSLTLLAGQDTFCALCKHLY